MQRITLNLVPSLIIESVKAETYLKGTADRATTEQATGLSFTESAGDEQLHERKLKRTMMSSIEELKGHLADFVETNTDTSGDNITSEISDDALTITLIVSDRFNNSYVSSLARLCSSYIENKMLFLWWVTLNDKQASLYEQLRQVDLQSIQRCFIKNAPSIPTVAYTQSIGGLADTITMIVGEDETVTYTLTSGAIDDIECVVDNPRVIKVLRGSNGTFYLSAESAGVTDMKLYSRHNSSVSKTINIIVTL